MLSVLRVSNIDELEAMDVARDCPYGNGREHLHQQRLGGAAI